MKRQLLICALTYQLICQLTPTSFGQSPTSSPSSQQQPTRPWKQQQPQEQAPPTDEDVVKITTNLVQVDAVITDQHGKLVTDLQPDEVRLLEDGRSQQITNFTLVKTGTASGSRGAGVSNSAAAADKDAPPAPPVTINPGTLRRTIALVVDDLGLSAESIYYVRRALKRFVDEEIQPGDLAAIISTGSGVGALQQFTADKRMLHAGIDRIRWNPMGRAGVDALPSVEANPILLLPDQEAEYQAFLARSAQFREDIVSSGTLGTMDYVVRGLGALPGRKSLLLVSDGIKIFAPTDKTNTSSRVLEVMRRLADQANRASVVIHSMDARGLQTLSQTAADRLRIMGKGSIQAQLKAQLGPRSADFHESQNGLNYLAQQTGGIFVRNRNDLNEGLRRIIEDQKGYYLIGYRPDESTFDPKTGGRKFHALTLKVTRAGKFNVRMRKGFYGVPGMPPKAEASTTSKQVVNALTSPFGAAGVQIRLTSAFANDARAGSLLRSMLHVRASDLTFSDEPDDWHKAEFDIVAITYGDNGKVIDQLGRTDSIKMRGATYQHILKEGFVYSVLVPIKKPGAYQLRVALRDHGSERVGSASQFVEVPDMKSDRLLLSGVLLSVVDPSGLRKPETPTPIATSSSGANQAQSGPGNDLEVLDQANRAAVRKFRQGEYLQYGTSVYNAQLDKITGRPRLQISVRLFGDSRSVFTGQPLEVKVTDALDLKRVSVTGAIQLGTDLVPGEYVLQVILTDLLADPKRRRATQFIDFEIVK